MSTEIKGKIKGAINEQAVKVIKHNESFIVCKNHIWVKYGFGYKCAECNYYTGLDGDLNRMINKLLNP